MDVPKSLGNEDVRSARRKLLGDSHIKDLAQLTARIRNTMGKGFEVPEFDPLDGGIQAEVLFLLEAPGAKAIASGFVSRNNPDETAKHFFLLNQEAGIERTRTIIWNAVPWYVGTGTKIRPARKVDVREADSWLRELLSMLCNLRFVAFLGKKALHAKPIVLESRPDVKLFEMPHPSPLFINHAPGNRERLVSVLRQLATSMAS